METWSAASGLSAERCSSPRRLKTARWSTLTDVILGEGNVLRRAQLHLYRSLDGRHAGGAGDRQGAWLDGLEIAVGDDVVFDAPRVRHHAATQGVNGGKGP